MSSPFWLTIFKTTNLKLARFPARSPLAVAALPSMSLIPSAPFTNDTDDQTMRKKLNGRSLDDKALSLTRWSRNCGTALPTNNLRLGRLRLPSVRAGLAFSGEADPPLRLPSPSGKVDPPKSKELASCLASS